MHQHNLRSRGIGSEELLVGGGAEEEVMEQYTDLKAKLYNRHGRTGPRWVHDFITNNLPECPSNIFRYISDEYAEQTGDKTPHTHRLYVVKSQTSPESGPYQIISMVCIGCRYHFVLEVDDVKLEASPCGKNRKNRPLHHFVWADSDSPAQLAKEDSKYYPIVARERFACSAPACTTELTLRVTRPRIAFRHTQILRDLERVKRRMEEAKRDCPGRFQELSPQWARSAVGTLHAYIRDVIDAKPEDEPRKIAKWNRRFYVQFGPECDSILKYLEFTPKTLDDGEDYWILPTLDPRDDITRVGSRRAFFEDVRHELFGLTVASQPDEAIKMLAARPRIERDLHADDYPRTMSNISNYDARDFALLGAMPDFSEALLAYAYRQEHRLNKARGQELFSAFKRVVQGRGNYDLEMFIASQESIFENEARQQQQAASLNQGGDDLLWQAYSFFRLPSDCDETDEFIINAYNVQVEASPKQKDTARECLAIIGRHRKSDKILAVAQGPMDLQEATAYLEVDLGWAPENIVQWSMVQINQQGKQKGRVAEAMRVIGEHLDDVLLKRKAAELASEDATFVIDKGFDDAAPGADSDDAKVDLGLPVGLDNIGNTCYLNSLLQYLFTVKAVRDIVLNFDEYKMELTEENIKNRRVGGYRFAIDEGEALVAQEFVKELQDLFKKLQTAPTRSVRPTQRLANAALLSTGQLMQGKAVPQATKGPVAASLNKELPPPPPPLPARPSPAPPVGDDVEMTEDNGGERAETASVVSSQTLVNATETSSDQSYVKVSASDESPGKTTSSSVVEINSEDLPALMDVNDKPDAANKDVTMADASGTAEPEPSKVPIEKRISNALDHSVRQGTEQQDVEEVMGNIIQRLHSAIRPTYEDAENKLQMDKITETFYCTMVNYTRKTEGGFNKEVIHERWLTAFPGTERISLYDALDRSFDLHYVEGTKLPRYTAIRALPPILHVCIQRSVENGRKNGNPVTLPDTLYLDRYMDQGVDSELMEARKLSWALKLRLRQLKDQESLRNNKDAEPHPDFLRDVVYEKEALPAYLDDGMVAGPSKPGPEDVPSILGFLTPSLQREVADLLPPPKPSPAALSASAKQRANPAPPTFDLSGGFQESALEEQQRLTAQLESLFSNMKREAYRLHAVICHQGQAARSGHYWVYIRDFESGRWRKYNDSRITEVSGDLDLKGEEYYVAYVREDMTTTAVDIPKRIISDEDLARLQQAQAVKLPRDAPDATTSNQATAADANGMDENANGASSSRNKADADAATKQPPAIEMQDFESEARHGQQEQLPRYDGAEWGPGYADGV